MCICQEAQSETHCSPGCCYRDWTEDHSDVPHRLAPSAPWDLPRRDLCSPLFNCGRVGCADEMERWVISANFLFFNSSRGSRWCGWVSEKWDLNIIVRRHSGSVRMIVLMVIIISIVYSNRSDLTDITSAWIPDNTLILSILKSFSIVEMMFISCYSCVYGGFSVYCDFSITQIFTQHFFFGL